MAIPGSAHPMMMASLAEPDAYAIERSVRFNSSDSAYLSRTPASAGNRKTWTWAGWVKQSAISGESGRCLFCVAPNTSTRARIVFDTGVLRVDDTTLSYSVSTQALFRDLSAWMHIVVLFDTTQANASDRVKLYVNGIQQSIGGATYPAQNSDGQINSNSQHEIGVEFVRNISWFDGYLADIHFIDGQALDPTSFGEFDDNGIWQPKAYTGTYGTNGFHLPFSDNSTAAALGTDTSGNSNTWTVNNISVTAGAGNDSLVDVPTNGTETDTGDGGEVRGNYCTWNPLDLVSATLANGNLQATGSSDTGGVNGTIGVFSGKWYWEVTAGSTHDCIGVWSTSSRASTFTGGTADSYGYFGNLGTKINNGSGASYGATFGLSDIIGIALDLDAGTLAFYKNNASQGTAFTGLTGGFRPSLRAGAAGFANTVGAFLNAGQRPFAYTAPSGFKALCTANLPDPVVTNPSEYMDVALYTGNSGTQTISGLDFSPDLVWIKNRAQADNNKLLDTVRGATEELESNTTDAEVTNADGLTQFNSDGFDLGADAEYNTNTEAYVAWTWDAGSSTVTNTQGSITSSVRANASAGFSIVTWTPQSTAGTVGHGLGVAPAMIITKDRDAAYGWFTYHVALGATNYLTLNSTNATTVNATVFSTAPTSTVFDQGTGFTSTNSYGSQVCYCFAPVDGYSSFGSYTGNGSADGPFVFTGMRPRWVLTKRTDSADNWIIHDTARDQYNVTTKELIPNSTSAEGSTTPFDILSNGFKLRDSGGGINASGGTYIYAAVAEYPFKAARAR